MAIRKSRIIDKTSFVNKILEPEDELDRESEIAFWNYWENLASQYTSFAELGYEKGKELETKYVIKWKECVKKKDDKCANEYFMKILLGHFGFIKAKINKVYLKRRNDIITTQDLFSAAVHALQIALSKYNPKHNSNARFLNYFESFLDGALLQLADTESVFTTRLSALSKINNNGNETEADEYISGDKTDDWEESLSYYDKLDDDILSDNLLLRDIVDLICYYQNKDKENIHFNYPIGILYLVIYYNKEKIVKELRQILERNLFF